LTGNSVRRVGSNSPPRSGPRQELRRGPGPDSVHSFFGRFACSSPAGGGVPKLRFSGWIVICVMRRSTPQVWALKCWSCWSVCRSGLSRTTFIGGIVELGAAVRAATSFALKQKVGLGPRSITITAGRTHPYRLYSYGKARWQFQAAGSTFPATAWLGKPRDTGILRV